MLTSYSALLQEAVANPNIRAHLSHINMDCQTEDRTPLRAARETKKQANSLTHIFCSLEKQLDTMTQFGLIYLDIQTLEDNMSNPGKYLK